MFIRALATTFLLALAWSLPIGVSAQQLESVEIIVCAGDPGFVIADNLNKFITAITFIIVLSVPMDKRKVTNLKLAAYELFALACIPVLVYMAGNFAINYMSGSL